MRRLTEEQVGFLELTSKVSEYRTNCPYCSDERRHLYINTDKKLFICFRCNATGVFVPNYTTDWESDTKFQLELYGSDSRDSKLESIVKTLPRSAGIINTDGYMYLRQRGLSYEEIKTYGFRSATDHSGLFSKTVILPINLKPDDTCDYFVCRKYDGKEPKYIHAPWPKDGTLFYAGDFPVVDKSLIITEGPFDAIKVARLGHPVCALLGKIATREQIDVLSKYNNLIIMLDPDAWTSAIKLKLQLRLASNRDGQSIIVVNLNQRDPGDSTEDEIAHVLEGIIQ
jgi:DNA primase